jgi:hypothetical protein
VATASNASTSLMLLGQAEGVVILHLLNQFSQGFSYDDVLTENKCPERRGPGTSSLHKEETMRRSPFCLHCYLRCDSPAIPPDLSIPCLPALRVCDH